MNSDTISSSQLLTLDQKITNFQEMSFSDFVKDDFPLMSAFWGGLRRKKEVFVSTIPLSKQIRGEIKQEILTTLQSEDISQIQRSNILKVQKILDSAYTGRMLTNLDLVGETVDLCTLGFHFSVGTIVTSVISAAHKIGFLKKKLSALDASLKQLPAGAIDVTHHRPNYYEELIELCQWLILTKNPFASEFIPVVEMYTTLRYRKRLVDIEIDMYRIYKEILHSSEIKLLESKESI